MAKANFVKKARKDYPEHNIKKGESYYWWSFRYGGKHYSKTPPKNSQLINSPFDRSVEELQERQSEMTYEDLVNALPSFIGDIESLRDECQDSLDNMPEGLQESSILNERIEGLESWIGELESLDIDIEEEEENDEEKRNEVVESFRECSYGG